MLSRNTHARTRNVHSAPGTYVGGTSQQGGGFESTSSTLAFVEANIVRFCLFLLVSMFFFFSIFFNDFFFFFFYTYVRTYVRSFVRLFVTLLTWLAQWVLGQHDMYCL